VISPKEFSVCRAAGLTRNVCENRGSALRAFRSVLSYAVILRTKAISDDTGKIIAHCIGLPPNDAKQPRRVGLVPFSATFQYAKVEYATPQAKQAKDQSQLRYALFLNAGAEPSESFVVFWVCL
jgi:hypothetical protein